MAAGGVVLLNQVDGWEEDAGRCKFGGGFACVSGGTFAFCAVDLGGTLASERWRRRAR